MSFVQRGLEQVLATLSVLSTDAAAALGLPCGTGGGTEGSRLYGFGTSKAPMWCEKNWTTQALDAELSQWQGDGWCLLESGLVFQQEVFQRGSREIPPWEKPWIKALAQHPYRHRMAWVGGTETLSVIPLLQASGISRYLHTDDVLAPLLLSDWLGRFREDGSCDGEALFPVGKPRLLEQRWVVDGTAALEKTVLEVMAQCYAWHTHALNELHTCLLEALTNALYHAPVGSDGALKYAKHSVLAHLPLCDQLVVNLALVEGWAVVCITDGWGRLTSDRLLQGLYHQTTDEGLLDEDGRGMLLMHLLPQGWANFCVPTQQHTAVFIHPTQAHPSPDAHPARSFWFVEKA